MKLERILLFIKVSDAYRLRRRFCMCADGQAVAVLLLMKVTVMRKSAGIIALTVFASTIGFSSVASALAFTLDSNISINDLGTGVIGELRAVTDGLGSTDTSGTHTDFGVVDFTTQDIFVVDLVLSGGSASVDGLGIAVGVNPFAAPIGGGYFNDGGGLITPSSTFVNLGGFSFIVDFDFAPTVDAGETTVRLFATYTTGMAIGQTATFMVSSGTNFTVGSTIVPEPGTGLLLGSGLLLVGLVRHGRKR